MKILVFSPYYPPHTGGLESHAHELNTHLICNSSIKKITVFTPQIPQQTPSVELIDKKLEIIRFPAFEIIANYPLPKLWHKSFWRMYYNLHQRHYDIVISRTRFFCTSLLALLYAKTHQTFWIHIEHGSGFILLTHKWKNIIAKLYDYTLGALIFKLSDINISISKAVQKFVHKFDQRVSPIIYRGLNTKKIDSLPAKKLSSHSGKIIITFVGRLYKWKGVEQTIKAIQSLPEKTKEKIVFLIIGDGEDFSRLSKLSEKESCIHIIGKKTNDEVIGYLKSSDIYIHASHPGGGLSTSLLEALYCQNIVIASPHEGADELIDSTNGILLPIMTPELLAKTLTTLLENIANYRPLGIMARNNVCKNFSWRKTNDAYMHIFAKHTNTTTVRRH